MKATLDIDDHLLSQAKAARAVTQVPGATMPVLGPEWRSLEKLCADLALDGNRIPDAWIAAAVSAG